MRSLKISVSCGLGAGTGTLLAVSLNPTVWWLGLLVGFAIGYLVYEYEKIPGAVKHAWEQTVSTCSPNAPLVKKTAIWLVLSPLILVLLAVWVYGWKYSMSRFCPSALSFDELGQPSVLGLWLFAAICALLSVCFASVAAFLAYVLTDSGVVAITVVIFGLAPITGIGVAAVVIAFVMCGYSYLVLREVMRYIYSELRLLCGCNAALGACVGYWVHAQWHGTMFPCCLTGCVLGVAFGLLSYQLVSKRWLKFGTT